MIRRLLLLRLCGLAACLLVARCADALSNDAIDRAQRSTALVDVDTPDGHAFGSSFCIRDHSTFITDGHVVADAKSAIKIVLHPGDKDQQIIDGHVLGIDYDADIAVLHTDQPGSAEPMALGDSDQLRPTQEVTAFGYPFGKALALDKDSYPSITVNTGKITSLRKENGELRLIQVDALVNPGNSGGPVLDAEGRVIGIVESGVPGAGLNFSTPVSRLKKMLQQPMVLIDPVVVDYPQRNKERTFSVHIGSLATAASLPSYDVKFTITDAKGGNQSASGKTSDGKCDLQLVPMTDTAPMKLNPFTDPPPILNFTITLTTAANATSTQTGKIVLSNVPIDFGIAQGTDADFVTPKGPHHVVNLLELVDPERDAVSGQWKMDKGALVSDSKQYSRLQFLYKPPEEYDFRVVFTGSDNVLCLHQICAKNERQFGWVIGAANGTLSRFEKVGGVRDVNNPTNKKADKWLTGGQEYTSVVKVRRTGVAAYLDGKLISAWRTDFSDMSGSSLWSLKRKDVIGVGSYGCSFTFRTVEIIEITGAGKTMKPDK